MRLRKLITALVLGPPVCLLEGCSTPGAPRFDVPRGSYARAFDATRQVLGEMRFELERVDARSGVITTRPKPTHGVASPWDLDQSGIVDELEDLLHSDSRGVRVTFNRSGELDPGEGDLREESGPIIGRVEVVVYRTHNPGWRTHPEAVGVWSRWSSPELRRAQMSPSFTVPVRVDPGLSARLAERIRRRVSGGSQAGAATSPDTAG